MIGLKRIVQRPRAAFVLALLAMALCHTDLPAVQGGRVSPGARARLIRRAVPEVLRRNPNLVRKLQGSGLLTTRTMDDLAASFESPRKGNMRPLLEWVGNQGFTPRVEHDKAQRFVVLSPEAGLKPISPVENPELHAVLMRSLWAAMRRDVIIGELGATPVRELEPHVQLSELSGKGSELNRYLTSRGVQDAGDVAGSFDWNVRAHAVRLTRDVALLRLFSEEGGSKPVGRFYFCCLERVGLNGWSDARGLALPPGNLAQDLAIVTVPRGTEIIVGAVADNFVTARGGYARGGNVQIFVPELDAFPYEHYRHAFTKQPASRVVVMWKDGGVLQFGR